MVLPVGVHAAALVSVVGMGGMPGDPAPPVVMTNLPPNATARTQTSIVVELTTRAVSSTGFVLLMPTPPHVADGPAGPPAGIVTGGMVTGGSEPTSASVPVTMNSLAPSMHE